MLIGDAKRGDMFLALNRKVDGLRIALKRRDIKIVGNLQANHISLKMRLLHNMVSKIFFPK